MSTPVIALWLLSAGWKPRLTVSQLRRQCAYAGVRSINGKSIKYARRSELIAALQRHA